MTDTPPLMLKRGSALRTSGRRDDDYDVLENGVVVGPIFVSPTAPTPPSYESAACPRSGSDEYEQSNHAQSGGQYC
jgi:hypothetical protein